MSVSRRMAPRSIKHVAAAVAPLAFALAGEVWASDVCERLTARLADLPAAVTTTANLRDFTGAISRQNIELRRAKNDRRRMECSNGSVIVIGGDNDGACAALDDTIARMEDNLRELKAQRQGLLSGGNDDMRRRILAAMEVNDCTGGPSENWDASQDQFAGAAEEGTEVRRNILRDLPPDSEDYPLLFDGSGMRDVPSIDEGGLGSFRTMCVRTCDGAFFPISSNATPADFSRDAELCRARCPGAETELYYHVLATEESDQMVSASTGKPYTELSTAFAYRARGVGAPGTCGCQVPKIAAKTSSGNTAAASKLSAVSPSVITIDGKIEPTTGRASSRPVEERRYDPAKSNVRQVGPIFLPKEESAIDLKHPTGPGYQPLQEN
ncbi:DUF2865 domain-containing protein [Sinorhizobium numidicum]|uniref:DUF2865 domain-containing protein n=1 Tax=Sinorhizobium numidicum TaxID=680248 RepID=A0ABY8CVE6_9HYPH|nr:DUF2865 domain-containing protein [Sinorhizobium numidicum]WEX75964.1 DUF2865 domain-containing protein [Sinorhizobium numidicum]WEX82623.1 DUF2865 domain-containing protein [Sinorhizobium numidicum]